MLRREHEPRAVVRESDVALLAVGGDPADRLNAAIVRKLHHIDVVDDRSGVRAIRLERMQHCAEARCTVSAAGRLWAAAWTRRVRATARMLDRYQTPHPSA